MYLDKMDQALKTMNMDKGAFVNMVKSGEVHLCPNPQFDSEGYLTHDTRPRNIANPKGIGYTLMAAV